MNNKSLIANLVILEILKGRDQFELIDSQNPHLGYHNSLMPTNYEDSTECIRHVIHREKLHYQGESVSFGGVAYVPKEFENEQDRNNWLVSVSIQDALIGACTKEQYRTLKEHVYRLWFNKEPRKVSLGNLVLPKNIVYDKASKYVSWTLGGLNCLFDLTRFLPPKEGRYIKITDHNHLLVVDGQVRWVFDLALRSQGWDALQSKARSGSIIIDHELLKADLTKTPLPYYDRNIVFTVPGNDE